MRRNVDACRDRVAVFCLSRCAEHERIAARWRRLYELLTDLRHDRAIEGRGLRAQCPALINKSPDESRDTG